MEIYQPNRFCCCTRCRSRHLMGPALLVTLGILFLLDEFGVRGASFHYTWPVMLIVIGVVKVLRDNAPVEGHIDPNQPQVPVSSPGPQGPGTTDASGQVSNV
jgi:hypothetical protein